MHNKIKEKKFKYYLNSDGEFIIENYNYAKPFANFFPGIAGKYGIPMWVFYSNRGQAIASFGTKDKDHAILEFFPANKSWQLSPLQGFRTFIKIRTAKKSVFYEPFHNGFVNLDFELTNRMSISSYDLKLEETNASLGLGIKVQYFTIPNASYAALVRTLTLRNLTSGTKKIQLIDGLPQIVPFGMNNFFLKELSRTIEAWMTVKNLENDAPFYALAVDPSDKPEVIHIKEGNFYLAFHYEGKKAKLLKPLVEPQHIFGPVTDFSCPYRFIAADKFQLPKKQLTQNITPCGFLLSEVELAKGEEKTFYSLIGHARSCDLLNSLTLDILQPQYLEKKYKANKENIIELQRDIDTKSSSEEFDLYTKQTYIDNIMRGGYPVIFDSTVFYIYSRKHGDLERDYNRFQIQPTYFSQGNGSYRDVNQNRRMDTWFNPDIKDDNIATFLNLIQTDGFNPLVVKGVSFILKDNTGIKNELNGLIGKNELEEICNFISKPFTPGNLILFLEENKIKTKLTHNEFLDKVLSKCQKNQEAEHGEGYWTDHWAYNLDLLENYLALYPEKLQELIFDKKSFTYFDNIEVVRPRNEKYTLYHGLPRQLHSIAVDSRKKELIKKRDILPHMVRTNFGEGEIYQTTLINKLFCLLVNKVSSFDPFGVGIEMEANKPNWYDALNGLPALFGSSSCETFEVKRLAIFIKEALEKTGRQKISLNDEVYEFLTAINKDIEDYFKNDSPEKDYLFWDKLGSLKESYRKKTLFGVSGQEHEIAAGELLLYLSNALKKINLGLEKALDKEKNIYYAYFINEVIDYSLLDTHNIKPIKFTQKKLPFFLESQMHALRLTQSPAEAKKLHKAVLASQLYDKKLKMYKVTASLEKMPEEIGRCRVFARGWLENESIWLHMEYKYLLELLKLDLAEEFYANFKSCLIPFQDPEIYGRSILENSSFITSSAFPDTRMHGSGFVARLSGSTAEFLQIWLLMNIGKGPFILGAEKQLTLKFAPLLAGWLFTKKEKTYSFNFLSSVKVIYHNPKMKNTFGKNKAAPKKIVFCDKDNRRIEIESDTIPSPYAEQIRSRQVKQIDIFLA